MSTIHTQMQGKDNLTVLRPNDILQFECRPERACYTRCCRNITIFLTPYDILQMKGALDISSSQFLAEYTLTMIGDKGLPVVMLKMRSDEYKSCPFVSDEGCTIYAARPWACRIYPLRPESTPETEKAAKKYYSVMDVAFCQGFQTNKNWHLTDWLVQQGVPIYEKMEEPVKEITNHTRLHNVKITNPKIQQMYYMTCYDLDRFRRFVMQSSFLDRFIISPKEVTKLKTDDIALYHFAFKWLKYGLLSKHELKIKPEAAAPFQKNNHSG